MVGTAIWWTKEEAERDAAATGLPIVGLGPMAGIAPVVQRQGEPLPITNDMHRLMEACRIGEFKDESGSETVEALAVASLDAKSSMGHDDDSYMAGYSAALYEQAEPFIWMALNSQRQGAPAAWRGLNELGEVVTEWIDGAPPSNMVDLSGNPASFARIEQAYTHTDPGEVEQAKAAHRKHAAELIASRVLLREERDTLRAQLAERDALLRKISGYHWANVDPEERARTRAELRDMLSASAEPEARS
ncbi:hypothetical protein D3C79_515990 [compost metagenome]